MLNCKNICHDQSTSHAPPLASLLYGAVIESGPFQVQYSEMHLGFGIGHDESRPLESLQARVFSVVMVAGGDKSYQSSRSLPNAVSISGQVGSADLRHAELKSRPLETLMARG